MIDNGETKYLADDTIDFNYLNDNLFFEAINLMLPKSKIGDYTTKKIQRSNSVPNFSLNETEQKTDKILDLESQNGIDYRPLIDKISTQVYTCLSRACGEEFLNKSDLIEHLKNSHKIKYEEYTDSILKIHSFYSYKCILKKSGSCCGKKLDSISKIASHIVKEHSLEKEVIRLENSNNEFKFLFDCDEIIICTYENCTCLFLNKTLYRKHKQFKHFTSKVETCKHICEICGSKFSRPNHLLKHLKVHERMKFKCDYCTQVFMKQSMLLTHLSSAHKNDEKLYKCKIEGCGREFICKMYLDSHMTKVHSDKQENNLYCHECKKQFPAPWLKNQHDEIKHKGNQLYKCLYESCGKTYSNSSKLHRHSQIHLKEKKYKCEVKNCNAEFNRREHLMSHLNVHNDGKPFLCEHPGCKAAFRFYNNLITHKKFHKQPKPTETISNPTVSSESIQTTFEPLVSNTNIYELKNTFDIKLANEKLNDYLKKVSDEKVQKPPAKRSRQQSLTVSNTQPDFDIHSLVTAHSPDSLPSTCFSEFIQPVYQDSSELITLLETDLSQNESKQEHVININSDDEEYTTCTVVLENLFGSARTDYTSNHVYIEKYRSKRKAQKEKFLSIKRVKSVDSEEVEYLSNTPSLSSLLTQSPSSSILTNSSLESIKSTLKQTLTSKQQLKNRPLTNSLSLDLDYNAQTKSDQNDLNDNSDVCFINCLDF